MILMVISVDWMQTVPMIATLTVLMALTIKWLVLAPTLPLGACKTKLHLILPLNCSKFQISLVSPFFSQNIDAFLNLFVCVLILWSLAPCSHRWFHYSMLSFHWSDIIRQNRAPVSLRSLKNNKCFRWKFVEHAVVKYPTEVRGKEKTNRKRKEKDGSCVK